MAVYIHQILLQFMIGPIEGDTVPFQFCQALCRDHLRKGVEAFHIISKLIEDLRVILLYRRAEPTQISNDAGILILLQILKHLDHGRLVLILKYLFPNAQRYATVEEMRYTLLR